MAQSPKTVVSLDMKSVVRIFVLAIVVILLYVLRDIVLVLLTSIVIASFVEGAVRFFRNYRIRRGFTVFAVYVISLAAVIGLFYYFMPIFISEISLLLGALSEYIPQSSFLNNLHGPALESTKHVVSNIAGNVPVADLVKSVQTLIMNVSGGFIQTSSLVFGSLFNVILIIIISFYLSMQERGIENFLRIVTPAAQEAYVIGLWQRTERKIGLWLQSQLLLGLIIGLIIYLGLIILGVDYALVLALIAAISELIPFGIILGAIPGIGFAYTTGGASLMFKAILMYFVVQQIENYAIQPLVVRRTVGISPLVVILSLLIGANLAGFWGLILGIPVAVCLLEYLDDVEKRKASA